jgi:hypothetical protein
MNRLAYLLSVLLSLVATGLHGQAFVERMKSVYDRYSLSEGLRMKLSVQVYENEQSGVLVYSESAEIRKSNQNYHYTFGSVEMLMNSHYTVMVDRNEREIVCSQRSPEGEKEFMKDPMKLNLDSLSAYAQEPEVIFDGEGRIQYRLSNSEGTIRQVDLTLDTNTHALLKLEYRYEDNHYVVIRFSDYDWTPRFDESEFSERRYFVKEGKRWVVAPGYAGYQLTVADSH